MNATSLLRRRALEHLEQARDLAARKWPLASDAQRDELARSLAQAMAQTAMQDEHRAALLAGECALLIGAIVASVPAMRRAA
jgi:hypothetical protein